MKIFILATILSLTCAIWAAPTTTTVVTRHDQVGNKPTDWVTVSTSQGWEVWGIGLNQPKPTFRVGRLQAPGRRFKVGGMVQVRDSKVSAVAAGSATGTLAGGKTFVWTEATQPLGSGKLSLTVQEARVLWPMGRKLEAGVAGFGTVQSGKEPQGRIGLCAKIGISKGTSAYLRWCSVGAQSDALRIQVGKTF